MTSAGVILAFVMEKMKDGPGSPLVACSLINPFNVLSFESNKFKVTFASVVLFTSICCTCFVLFTMSFCLVICLCFVFSLLLLLVDFVFFCAHSLTSLWYGSLSVALCVRLFSCPNQHCPSVRPSLQHQLRCPPRRLCFPRGGWC